jgi:acyl-coenzyme A thioesterase PaaI-like protein
MRCAIFGASRAPYPGRLIGRGRVVRLDEDIGFMEAELFDADENVVAVGLATARVIALDTSGR